MICEAVKDKYLTVLIHVVEHRAVFTAQKLLHLIFKLILQKATDAAIEGL